MSRWLFWPTPGAPGGFDPSSLSPAVWLEMDGTGSLVGSTSGTYSGVLDDEAAIDTALTGDELCSQWDDLSGNGRHFAQGTAASQPLWQTSAESAFDLPSFLYASEVLVNGTGLASVTSGFAVTAVFTCTNVALQQTIFNTRVDATQRAALGIFEGEVRAHLSATNVGQLSSTTIADSSLNIAHYTYNGTTPVLRLNGATQSGTNALVSGPADVGMYIGARTAAVAQPFKGQIAAVLARTSPWTSTEMDDLDTYLSAKYGV